MSLYFGSINFNKNTIQQKSIAFRGSESTANYFDFLDTVEISSEKETPKAKKKGLFTNPIKAAQEQAKAILKEAKQQAYNITTQARLDSQKEAEEFRRKAKFEAETYAKRHGELLKGQLLEEVERSRSYYDTQIAELKTQSDELSTTIEKKRTLIQSLNDGFIEKEIATKKNEIMSRVNAYTIDYDYNKPIQEQKAQIKIPVSDGKKIKFSDYEYIPKSKQVEKQLEIPEFVMGQDWSFTVPQVGNLNLPEYEPLQFSELHNQETNISMNYADSVQWNTDKISRDILQNFFDGHGQTLDGVSLNFEKQENGKYKVRIEGKSQYSQEKAILLGESTKRNNLKAAGNYGEGLKVVVLKLLKEYGASSVDIASDNWNVRFTPKKSNICEKEILSYSLLKQNQIEGNYLEFETDNEQLLCSLRSAINNFYHSNNTDFQNLDFENEEFAFKKLSQNEKGSVYIAGQKFEYFNLGDYRQRGWNAVPGYTLIFKNKPTGVSGFDISRDRMILQSDHIKSLVQDSVASENTSIDDISYLLNALKSAWKNGSYSAMSDVFSDLLLKSTIAGAYKKGIKFDFPEFYLASQKGFNDNGYDYFYERTHFICKPEFAAIGMKRTIEKAIEDKPQHLVQPSEIQTKKIAIIKETINCLKSSIQNADFRYSDRALNPNIYIFEKSDVFSGKHRTDGFWISSSELCASFNKVISTVLHEISHDFGGDGTKEFTYTLTNMLNAILHSTLKDEETLITLRALKSCWEDINSKDENWY